MKIYRPPIRPPYIRMLKDMLDKINESNMNRWRFIDVVLYALELLYLQIFPDRKLPMDIKGIRKRYYMDVDVREAQKQDPA